MLSEQLATGGAERVAALLSVYFENHGVEVTHLLVQNKVEYPYAGQIINLGKHKKKSGNWLNKIERLRMLNQILRDNQFDFIIDFRVKNNPIQEWILSRMIFKTNYITTIHSYISKFYFPKNTVLAKSIYKNCHTIVCVSKEIELNVNQKFGYSKTETLYNPVDIEQIEKDSQETINCDFEYILGVGRMQDNIKQFDKLIEAYSKSSLINQHIHLIILGDGDYQAVLKKQVQLLNIEKWVHFLGKVANPFKYMKRAKFTALTSRNEGFGNVLVESLACQTPVVSFNCPAGPSEIVIDKTNGLLVENQNLEKLIEAFNLFTKDTQLYNECKKNALESVQKFNIDAIGKQWFNLLQIKKT